MPDDVLLRATTADDKPVVEEIGTWLKGQGVCAWLDKWELPPASRGKKG